ncbi:MAG TPA: AsmA family protein [Candidatus Solibacter sp.]|nr:AsmA family protein [Candidatus Solibacter sp.]
MKLLSSKRRKFAAAALIVLFLFLLRPGASRLKSRIIYSISWAVGRPVDIGSVHLRFLPRPGFDLENFVVYDDPAFGAEPILRSSDVTAALRLTSFFRGHLEIAQLDLTEPSLNLVHGPNGRWNLEALLERTAHTPTAPTAKAKFEHRPGFPYIQATSARINFKNGQEKKPYALTNADFSLWQESDNTWGLRLKAQPLRSDLNLNDIGLVQVEGTWQRAENLRDTPLQLTLQWNRAQLGQATKFFSGNDQGWRGSAQVNLTASGTPANLKLAGDFTIDDFRRFDITRGQPLHIGVHCAANYVSTDHVLHELACLAPIGQGLLALGGEVGLPGSRRYDLSLTAERVPLTSALALVERVKKNLPDDLTAQGLLAASAHFASDPATPSSRFEGHGELSDFQLASASTKSQLGAETIPFTLSESSASTRQRGQRWQAIAANPVEPAIEIGPFPLVLARAQNPSAHGRITRTGYTLAITGDAEISRTLRLARLAGLPALQAAAEGTVQLDLQIGGSWAGWTSLTAATAPQVTGSAKLRNVRVALRGVEEPIEISSADLQLSSDLVRVNKLNAHAADAAWTGSLSLPRGCGTPAACEVDFDLSANQLSLSAVSQWANPGPKARPWYRLLESSDPSGPSILANLRASGQLHADTLRLKNISATRVSADVTLDAGVLEIDDLSADLLGGTHHGSWQADFTAKPAACSGSGKLERITLSQLGAYMHDSRLAGTADAAFDLKADCHDFWPSAEGKLQFDVRNGVLSRLTLNETEEPFRITHFSGSAHLLAGKFELTQASLDSPGGKFQVTGTASLARELDLKLRPIKPSGEGYAIAGTLAEPRVQLLSHTEQAKLKTDSTK